jgi:shikimate dehydrogenase
MTEKFAVLGKPISHSKSPIIHRAAFEFLHSNATYESFELGENLAQFLESHSDYSGFSVTMPLKDEAFRVAGQLDDIAQATRSVNTLVRTPDGWRGHNTDVFGIQMAVQGCNAANAIVLGTGATARSAVWALLGLGLDVSLWGRSGNKTSDLASRYSIRVEDSIAAIAKFDLVVSTLPAMALDEYLEQIVKPKGTLLDVAYEPWPSKAATHWGMHGKAISGVEMLLWQAIAQQRIFAGLAKNESLQNEDELVAAVRVALSMAQ